MPRIIIIGGAPGSGKSTLARGLRASLGAVWVDFGRLREFHLRPDWSDQSAAEESMTFENLTMILRNSVRHGYPFAIVEDLRDARVCQIPNVLADLDFQIITLVVGDENELRRRIVARNDGWRDADGAVEWNRAILARPLMSRESLIEAASKPEGQILAEALHVLGASMVAGIGTRGTV
jgi:predicted kinase